MAAKKEEVKVRRVEEVKVRFTPEEKVALREKANLSGMSLSKFIRQAADNKTIVSIEDTEAINRLANEVNRIGVNLNQIAKWVNTYGSEVDVEEVTIHLEAISEALNNVVGRC